MRMYVYIFARVVILTLALGVAACATQQVENRSILENQAEGDPGVVIGRLPACEKGQIAGEGGKCLDVVVGDHGGNLKSMRERILERDCDVAGTMVAAAARRRRDVISVKGHEVHLGLNAIVAECKAREEQLDICERAGRYAPESPDRNEKVRNSDGLVACSELAELYRAMLSRGIRRAP
jgi:hypothetical protein